MAPADAGMQPLSWSLWPLEGCVPKEHRVLCRIPFRITSFMDLHCSGIFFEVQFRTMYQRVGRTGKRAGCMESVRGAFVDFRLFMLLPETARGKATAPKSRAKCETTTTSVEHQILEINFASYLGSGVLKTPSLPTVKAKLPESETCETLLRNWVVVPSSAAQKRVPLRRSRLSVVLDASPM